MYSISLHDGLPILIIALTFHLILSFCKNNYFVLYLLINVLEQISAPLAPPTTHIHFFVSKLNALIVFFLSEYRINSFFCPNKSLLRYDQEKGQKCIVKCGSGYLFNITIFNYISFLSTHKSVNDVDTGHFLGWQEAVPLRKLTVSTESFFLSQGSFWQDYPFKFPET